MQVLEKILEEVEERLNMVGNIPVNGDDDFRDGEECYEDGRVQGRYEELVWCRDIIRERMSVDEDTDVPTNNNWILCSERLPEPGELCYVTCEDGSDWLALHTISNGWIVAKNSKPIAWVRLPKPYKPDKSKPARNTSRRWKASEGISS